MRLGIISDTHIPKHSHIPFNQFENEILLFNPGSPTDKRKQRLYSVGIIDIGIIIHGQIIYFESKD